MRGSLLTLVFVCLFSALPAFSQRVIEADSVVSVAGDEIVVSLAVESDGPKRDIPTRVELVDPSDATKAVRIRRDVELLAGKQSIEFRLPAVSAGRSGREDLAWYRLRYTIGAASGVVSVSQLLRDLFELRIISSDSLLTGMTHRSMIRAVHPFTDEPAAGVKVETRIDLDLRGDDDEKLTLSGSGVTDADGFAVVDLKIPVDARLDGGGEITVTGSRNGLVRKAKEDLNALADDVEIVSMSDKPIYQPGQTLQLRGIALKGSEAKTVLTASEIEFRITDEDDTLLYREKVVTSAFGIATIGWQIPQNAKLGQYRIEMRDSEGRQVGGHSVKITRYDLPNFAVTAKPSKPYYLPADKQAEIEIKADYLFGKPVTKGKVRVVQEMSREWNWKEQKYEIDEGEVREGETDAGGKFIATFDLAETHEELADDDDERYEDLKFAAYFTDPTTNKTEQRRFDVRVSREPVHVYLIRGDGNFGNPELPLKGYVSTFYPDGTAAVCDVEIQASEEGEGKFRTYSRVKTNSYGGARFTIPRPAIGEPDDDLDFRIVARDRSGRRGTLTEEVYFNEGGEAVRVTTDRAIYKPGEMIDASIESTVETGTVHVDVVSGWSVIASHSARLTRGKARLRIPYSEKFRGQLKIAAFLAGPGDIDLVRAATGVLFPAKQGVNVDAHFDKTVYKPNEEATVKFGIVDSAGQTLESALGVVVLDKAVEERARTDAEFGGMFRNLGGWLGYGDGFGSVNVKDLNELDLTKPISPELQLVGEIILHDAYYRPGSFRSDDYARDARSVFEPAVREKLRPVEAALNAAYQQRAFLHPVNDAGLTSILDSQGLDFGSIRDPWGEPFRATYAVVQARNLITITSGGPDKKPGTKDDIIALTAGFEYFTPAGRMVDAAVQNFNARTGAFIRTEKELFAEMGVRELLDRFGRPYLFSFDGEGRTLRLNVKSSGPDGRPDPPNSNGDDFQVWTSSIDLFAATERKIDRIQANLKTPPASEAEFKAALKAGGVDFDKLRDGGGKPLYILAEKRSRYWDRITAETVLDHTDGSRRERRTVTPVTQQIIHFTIRGPGRDGKPGTYDDTTFTRHIHVLSEQSNDDPKPVSVTQPISFSGGGGAIAGVVTDPMGAVVPAAQVTATNDTTRMVRATTTNDEGRFLFANLPTGVYSVKAVSPGFKATVVEKISVTANAAESLTLVLEAGSVSEVVEVTAAADSVNTTDASSGSVESRTVTALPLNARNAMQLVALQPGAARSAKKPAEPGDDDEGTSRQTSTPRLREYFPETLLWRPEVVTDSSGKAELKSRMADNITTWKLYTIASTKDGKIGAAEKEVAAFQSFFVDLDPPKFLTTGDEIHLPTQVRNYTEKKQNVNVTMAKADWFGFLNGDAKQVSVASGGSENAVFGFKAVTPVKEGRQRVTAVAETDSDAIERAVTVRPDGREVVRTDSRFFSGEIRLEADFPTNALPGTHAAELKIYPNLMAHVAESVEGLLRRPYGCGEQTISSTYPNVMILKFADPAAGGPRRISEPVERKARKFLQRGYERLLGYQAADGGFSYWGGKDQSDFALTAYALRFLADAAPFIQIDAEAVRKAEDWLIRQQRADGSWNRKYYGEDKEDDQRTRTTTTYVARTIAMRKATASGPVRAELNDSLAKALTYLRSRNAEIDDPYSLSLFGLAALDAGDEPVARTIGQKLLSLARAESDGVYWNLEANTAFNGWGSAGRIEATALATNLLVRLRSDRDTVGKAMAFLLKNKDRYGVWYSTQTTVNVLDAFIAVMASENGAGTQQVQVVVNGQALEPIIIGPDKLDQISVPLDGKLTAGRNVIELRSGGRSPLMAQIVANHHIPWQDADASGRNGSPSRALRLEYKCDRTEAAIMQEISCTVEAERIAHRGYGMLLAEIGTPPGADVSRESLQAAMDADWSLSRYDILPDRVVLYMWAKPGGTKFSFKFRPRYGINAQSPASLAYDYYNPEAQAVVAPLRFNVK